MLGLGTTLQPPVHDSKTGDPLDGCPDRIYHFGIECADEQPRVYCSK